MGRKRTRKSRKSKGSMNSISKTTLRSMRADNKKDIMRTMLNKLDAWKKGKRVIVNEDGLRKEAKEVWGNPNKKFSIGRK